MSKFPQRGGPGDLPPDATVPLKRSDMNLDPGAEIKIEELVDAVFDKPADITHPIDAPEDIYRTRTMFQPQMQAELQAYRDANPEAASKVDSPIAVQVQPIPKKKRSPWLWLLIGTILLVGGGLGGYAWWIENNPPKPLPAWLEEPTSAAAENPEPKHVGKKAVQKDPPPERPPERTVDETPVAPPVDEPVPPAAKAYMQEAEAGSAHAMRMLAVMYYNGLNVPQDRKKGLEWYRRAAEAGSDVAKKELRAIEKGSK
jgi:Sel1 repeat